MKLQNRKKVHDAGAAGKKASEPQPTNHPSPPAKSSFPIVGIGASAGGLEAFTDLLKHLPTDTGSAFVLVQHLDPQHESALSQLLGRVTPMPVQEVTNNLRVKPNHIYAIPPNRSLIISQGILKLQPRSQNRTPARTIDAFFESLAQDKRERAIGVVLSGTASDGTVGLEAIKAEGGITFAQDDSARYDSMPRSAVAAGCVDFVLKPEDIAKELVRIARHPYVAGHHRDTHSPEDDRAFATSHEDDQSALPPGGHGIPPIGATAAVSQATARTKPGHDGFKKIVLLLRNHSGVDFSLYKSTTIQRRINRRVVLNKQTTLDEYATFLRGNAKELDALYSDVLISVTSFFRNPEAFDLLKSKVFPKLLQQRRDQPVRVWVLGCSTGQEAYSIAMAYVEATENAPRARKLQVFATDLNDALLDKARHALYAKTLAQDVSPERLRRFFVEEEAGFSSMLVEEAGKALSKTGQNHARRINRSAQFMDAMLIDMLAFSRIGQQRLDLVPVNLETVIRSILSRLEPDVKEKNARVEAPGPWPMVLAHQPLLEQILFNLVSNALKFVPSGTAPQTRLRAETPLSDPSNPQPSVRRSPDEGGSTSNSQSAEAVPKADQLVRVWVEDNGIGIPAEHQAQIFRLFNRLHGDKYPGTGIGLSIVQKGAERMGGTAGVESARGQGSRFWIELRKAPAH